MRTYDFFSHSSLRTEYDITEKYHIWDRKDDRDECEKWGEKAIDVFVTGQKRLKKPVKSRFFKPVAPKWPRKNSMKLSLLHHVVQQGFLYL